jgi:hypothetical protein
MSPRTLFLSRLIGLYCILIALSMITRKQATLESATTLLHDPSMMFVLGAIPLVAGLAMVLMHNIWSGSTLVVIVTLVGWMTLIKSLSFLFLPKDLACKDVGGCDTRYPLNLALLGGGRCGNSTSC